MCGRFVAASPPDELARYFAARPPEHELESNFNVAPTDEVYVVRADHGHRQLATVRWGLVPFWAKEAKAGAKMINARAESVLDKPAFRSAVRRHRCLIPADGFYEWARVAGHKAKQPYYIHRSDGEPLVFAGLWERWRPPGSDRTVPALETCAVITCGANATMAAIHDRMPVVLPPSAWDTWLAGPPAADGGGDEAGGGDQAGPGEGDGGGGRDTALVGTLAGLLIPSPDDLLTLRPVTTAVNRVANNGPELLEVEPHPLVARA